MAIQPAICRQMDGTEIARPGRRERFIVLSPDPEERDYDVVVRAESVHHMR